ncbi:MAG: GIY-YIG nuclease family protein [Methanobacteriaceae archaeon]|nr:GIY-YIG nuclease family protein [Methanobacteriaceae archaeon]MDO9626659.1 GIY-YIG nuclease family protein [Methanobacteriaceae archaeon]
MKGTYCLIIEVEKDSKISVGRLEELQFKRGFYIYVGSALNSLESRVTRHLSSKKKLHWHADYLLMDSSSNIKEVIYSIGEEKIECSLASLISDKSSPMIRFGCSDCSCVSHLFYFKDYDDALKGVLSAFEDLELSVNNLDDFNKIMNKNSKNKTKNNCGI